MSAHTIVAGVLLLFAASTVSAQTFSLSGGVVASQWSEFEGADLGGGVRFTWSPLPLVSLESELTVYPGDYPDRTVPFSAGRFEGLFGATIGPRLHRIRPFVRGAAGFLQVSEPTQGFACIAIFPPPLSCLLAAGQTLPAFDVGGGIEVSATERLFFRADVSDRILKYPGPTYRQGLDRRDEGFYGHALRIALGAGVRF